jgi:hypothetical protein
LEPSPPHRAWAGGKAAQQHRRGLHLGQAAALCGGGLGLGQAAGVEPAGHLDQLIERRPPNIYTVAGTGSVGFAGDGGPATSAEFNRPRGVAVDSAGNIAIADTNFGTTQFDMGNNRVRVVAASTGTFYGVPMTAGDIYTVAGNGTPGFSGDGHAAARAELDEPFGVGTDAAGNLLIAGLSDGRVRQVSG